MQHLKNKFAEQLQQKLRNHYGRIPSCAVFARDFSLLARDVEPISVETARKWIRGKALPHAARMRVLCAWLNMDFSLSLEETSLIQSKPANNGHDRDSNGYDRDFQHTIERLRPEELKVLKEIANLYVQQRLK